MQIDTQNWAKFEEKILDNMLEIYTSRCEKSKYFKEKFTSVTPEKVKQFFKRKLKDGDWYLTSHEAVYYGLADNVITHRNYGSINSLK